MGRAIKTREELFKNEVSKLISKPTEARIKKREYKKRGVGEIIKPEWHLLMEYGDRDNIDKLMGIYRDNPLNAYVYYTHNKYSKLFREGRVLLFIYSKKHFEIVTFEKVFGISKTNRIYSSKKKVSSIIYKDNKMWIYEVKNKIKTVKPITLDRLKMEMSQISEVVFNKNNDEYISMMRDTFIYKFMISNFFWFKALMEYRFGGGLTISTIISKKLFSHDKLNKHIFKMNKVANDRLIKSDLLFNKKKAYQFGGGVDDLGVDYGRFSQLYYVWKEILNRFEDLEHFDFGIIKTDEGMFFDTIDIAKKLNKKISGRWGFKRLKSMHDLWSIELQNILLDCEVERGLNISKVFDDFANFSGYKLFRTNKELLKEGMEQKHCVGTYIDRVDSGECGIYNVGGYTLQLNILRFSEVRSDMIVYTGIKSDGSTNHMEYCIGNSPKNLLLVDKKFKLNNNQFKGRFNESAPKKLVEEVEGMLYKFSLSYDFDRFFKDNKKSEKREEEQLNFLEEIF